MSRQKKEGMHCVAIGEGLSVEVSLQLRTEGHRRARHVQRKGKGVQAMWEPRQRGQAAPWHMQVEPSYHLSVLPAPNLAPSHSGLCSPDNSKQTLGLVITDWSWEDRQHRSPGLCGTFQDIRRVMPRGKAGGRAAQPSQLHPSGQSLENSDVASLSPQQPLRLGGRSKNHPGQTSSGSHAPPRGPHRGCPPPDTPPGMRTHGRVLSLELASSSSAL